MARQTVSVQFQLDRGERQLWSGAPRQGIMFRAADLFVVPFSIMWTGFAVFWETMAARMHAPFFFKLFGVPFILMGLFMIGGRFFVDARRRARTIYAITSDRVIISSGSTTTSLDLRTLGPLTLSEGADGSGSIAFGPMNMMPPMNGTRISGLLPMQGFEAIPDARRVYGILHDAQRDAVNAAAPAAAPGAAPGANRVA